jgi:small subunit ribosomal protein S13
MIRLLGVDLPKNKSIEYALTSIYGIGLKKSRKILLDLNIDLDSSAENLKINEVISLRNYLETISASLEGNLKRFNKLNINHLIEINCYRGSRHRLGLPLRGQRTRTNAKTRRIKKNIIKK